jgi:hypothetical protein
MAKTIRRGSAWSMRAERELIALSRTHTLEALADHFERSPAEILKKAARLGGDQARDKMTKPPRSNKSEFSKREIGLFVLVMIVATILTVEATNFILKTFVIGNPNDPLTKAGGLSTSQERETRKGK